MRVLTMNGIDIRTAASPQQALLVLNLDAPILSDRTVRQAVFTAIDRETLARIRFTGLNYTEELPPGSLSLYPFQPGYEDNLAGVVSYDPPAKLPSCSRAPGGARGGTTVCAARTANGCRWSCPTSATTQPRSTCHVRCRRSWARWASIWLCSNAPSADFSAVIVNKEFDLFMMGGFSSSDPFGMAYFCQVWCSDSQFNPAGAGSPELDARIEAMARIGDPMAQIAAGNRIERDAFAQFSNLPPLFNGPPAMVAVKEDLANYGAGQFYVGPIEDIGWEK